MATSVYVLCLCEQLAAGGIVYCGCPWRSVCLCSLLQTTCEISPHLQLWCSCRYKDELIRFWGTKVKDEGHSESTFGRYFLTWCMLMTLVKLTHYHVNTTLITSSRSCVQRSRSQTTFCSGIPIDGWSLTCLLCGLWFRSVSTQLRAESDEGWWCGASQLSVIVHSSAEPYLHYTYRSKYTVSQKREHQTYSSNCVKS